MVTRKSPAKLAGNGQHAFQLCKHVPHTDHCIVVFLSIAIYLPLFRSVYLNVYFFTDILGREHVDLEINAVRHILTMSWRNGRNGLNTRNSACRKLKRTTSRVIHTQNNYYRNGWVLKILNLWYVCYLTGHFTVMVRSVWSKAFSMNICSFTERKVAWAKKSKIVKWHLEILTIF